MISAGRFEGHTVGLMTFQPCQQLPMTVIVIAEAVIRAISQPVHIQPCLRHIDAGDLVGRPKWCRLAHLFRPILVMRASKPKYPFGLLLEKKGRSDSVTVPKTKGFAIRSFHKGLGGHPVLVRFR